MEHYKQNYMVKLFKILANANRLKILQVMAQTQSKPQTVGELADKLGMHQATLSNHLIKMRENGIIKAKQVGTNMHYSIKDENALKFAMMVE